MCKSHNKLQNFYGIICLNVSIFVYTFTNKRNPCVNHNHTVLTTSIHRRLSEQNDRPKQFAKLKRLNVALIR